MAENTQLTAGDGLGDKMATREVVHAGETVKLAGSWLAGTRGVAGSFEQFPIDGSVEFGLCVDVQRVVDTVSVAPANGFAVQVDEPVEVTNAGTFAVQVDAAVEVTNTGTFAVQIDPQAVEDLATLAGTVNAGAVVVDIQSAPALVRTADSVAAAATTGVVMDGATEVVFEFAVLNANQAGDNEVIPARALKRLRVLEYTVLVAAAVVLIWKSGATPITGPMTYGETGGASVPHSASGKFETAAGEALNVNLDGAVLVGGHLVFIAID